MVAGPITGYTTVERQAEAVIIGAGFAGLMAARRLVAAGVPVAVLEARDRVGGKIYTRLAQDGTPIDVGGQWIGPTQDRLRALAQEFGLATFPSYDTGKHIEIRAGQRRIYTGAIPTTDPAIAMETVELLLNLNLMSQAVPLEAPWMAPQALLWDAMTVQSWLDANITTPEVRTLLMLAVRAVFCIEPRDLSLLHFLFYIHSGGSLNQLISVTRGAQEEHFVDGAQMVANRMADDLGDRIILNAPVHTIIQTEEGVRVLAKDMIVADDTAVSARYAIVALSPTLAGRIRYAPALPARRDQLTQRMPQGTTIKVQCLYPTPFWREEGLSGQVLSDGDPVSITFDNSPASGTPGILLGFIEGDAARQWTDREADARRAMVLDCFTRYFGSAASTPTEYFEQAWANEEYSRGCYAGYMPPGVWTMYGEALRQPCGRIHWAGTETATVWNGYMDGALQSGDRAAAEVLAKLNER